MKLLKKSVCLWLAVLTAILAAALAGCSPEGASSELTPENQPYTIATGVPFAPFEFKDISSGEYVGIDIDLLAAIADDQNFEYTLRPLEFDSAVVAMETNQVDAVMAGMSITQDRLQKYDFSDPYYDSGIVMAVSAGNDDVHSYQDLRGKRVAVRVGTEGAAFAEAIKGQYGFSTAYFNDSPMMYEDIRAGQSIACFEDYPVMAYGIAQGNGFQIATNIEQKTSYGFAVMKNRNAELLQMFNAGLSNIRSNGKYQQIIDQYIQAQ